MTPLSLDLAERQVSSRRGLRLRIVCPSQEFSSEEMTFGTGRWMSCVRGLWESLAVINHEDLVVVMLQSAAVPAVVLDYLFCLHPRGPQSSARHHLCHLTDISERHLADKVLAAPNLVTRLRALIDQARRHGNTVEALSSYAASPSVAALADALGLELAETPTNTLTWGTKAGSRQVFRDAAVAHPVGTYQPVHDPAELLNTLADLSRRYTGRQWMIKINSGFGSGHGNAAVDLQMPRALGLDLIRPVSPAVGNAQFIEYVIRYGAIVEEHLGVPSASPSALAHIGSAPVVLATHEQLLDSHQSFHGARFPCDDRWRPEVIATTEAILTVLARRGVRGHVGIDFHAGVAATESRKLYCVEINLRQTGTTHAHQTLRNVLDGHWLPDGTLTGRNNDPRVYTTTDSHISPSYVGIDVAALIAELRRRPGLGFNYATSRGVIPHLWTTLQPFGKIGCTVVGRSLADCHDLEAQFVEILGQLSRRL